MWQRASKGPPGLSLILQTTARGLLPPPAGAYGLLSPLWLTAEMHKWVLPHFHTCLLNPFHGLPGPRPPSSGPGAKAFLSFPGPPSAPPFPGWVSCPSTQHLFGHKRFPEETMRAGHGQGQGSARGPRSSPPPSRGPPADKQASGQQRN